MRKIFAILCTAVILVSCGGKSGGGIKKDAKADFTVDGKTLKEMGDKDEATRNTYEKKVVEMKGYIQSSETSKSSVSPNKYVFQLGSDPNNKDEYTICYTDTDQTANVGKQVTVKGHFDYAGVVTLDDCIVY